METSRETFNNTLSRWSDSEQSRNLFLQQDEYEAGYYMQLLLWLISDIQQSVFT